MFKLVVTNGAEKRVVALTDAPVTIGRDPDNTVTVDGADVSRRHCRIEPDGHGAWIVVDLGSKNGTFLNGQAIVGPSRLGATDRLAVGEATAVVLPAEDPELPVGSTPAQPVLVEKRKPSLRSSSSIWGTVSDGDPFGISDHDDPEGSSEDEGASAVSETHSEDFERRATRGFLKDRLLQLNLLGQAIASELDLDRLLDAILRAAIDFTGFERGLLLLADEHGELRPVQGRNMDHEQLDVAERNFSRKVIDTVLQRKDVTLMREVDHNSGGWDPKASWSSLGLKSALCMPLVAPLRGRSIPQPAQSDRRRARIPTRLLGVIYLDSTSEVRDFDTKDKSLLRAVGAQAAIALQNARLHQQATTDPLTQLANRGFFEQVLHEELKRATDEGLALTVLMVDIDRFKQVNDRFGHQVGDQVLRETARRIRDAIRRDDTAGRYGGEEFIVLLPGAGLEAAMKVAQKIRMGLKAFPMSEEQVPVTASIGAAVFPEHGQDGVTLTKRADQALYLAKHSGRDRAEMWRAALDRSGHRMDALAGIVSGDAARDQRNLKILFDTIALARTPIEANDFLTRVLDKVLDLTRGERALLFLGGDSERLELAATRGRNGTPLPSEFVQYSTTAVKNCVVERRATCQHYAGDEATWTRRGPASSIENLRLKTIMCAPLTSADRLLGAIYVDDESRRDFTENDLVVLEALANQLSMALAFDPRFNKERRPTPDELTLLRAEVTRLRDENSRLRGGPTPS